MKERPRLLIEQWLPASAIGIECMRENSTGQHPPPNRLHVWWTRKPLTVARAAVLASLLPADFPKEVFERLLGFEQGADYILQAQAYLDSFHAVGLKAPRNPFGQRAYRAKVPESALLYAHDAIKETWGDGVVVIDPMAGGGSIPLETMRLGIPVIANELNPVAGVILKVILEVCFKHGKKAAEKARLWAERLRTRFDQRMRTYYPKHGILEPRDYLHARTVPCPDTGYPTPLVHDWHVVKPASHGANCTPACLLAEPVVDTSHGRWHVRFVQGGNGAGQLPRAPHPTYVRGKGVSLFTDKQIDEDYLKTMAQQGKMGSQLYAVAVKTTRLEFRPPSDEDFAALQRAEEELRRLQPQWERDGILPTERIPGGDKTKELLNVGMNRWADMFAPRQLLAMGVLVEELRRLEPDILRAEGEELGKAVLTLLALVIDKFLNYNCIFTRWHTSHQTVAGKMDRHDYSFKATFAELAACGAGGGLEWAIDNVLEAYEHLCDLPRAANVPPVTITLGSATSLPDLDDRSVTAVVVDPPYADNVQYAELADFFYVWLKRTVGHLYPGWFATYLCDHSEEAVVNLSRFRDGGKLPAKEARKRAHAHYHQLMREVFRECWRVLRDDGVLTVMFTHKAQEAWEALFESLIASGFTITATWPVKTESEHSLHQARKNAAQSTVLLVARKRAQDAGIGYWDVRMQTLIRQRVRETAERLQREGLNRVDQLVGTFGAAMEVFSRYDEVRTDTGERVPVGVAIDLASDAVMEWRIEQIAQRSLSDVEPEGRFILLCWDVLGAAEFRFNEAKLIGHAVGMSPDALVAAGLLEKDSENVRILSARERRRAEAVSREEMSLLLATVEASARRGRGARRIVGVHPNDPAFRTALDGCHALALRYLEAGGGASGIGSARALAARQGWGADSTVARLMHALVLTAPEALRREPHGERDLAAQYAEFRAWHALLQPLFGIEPPDWTPRPPEQPTLPGASWEGEEQSEEEEEQTEEET